MPGNLIELCFAALLAFGGLSPAAAEMPASGTKNFIPGGEAPSYFSNESGMVSTAATDMSAADDGADRISGSPRFPTGLRQSAHTSSRRHSKLSASYTARRYTAADPRGRTRPTHVAGASKIKTASVSEPARPIRNVGSRETKTAKTAMVRPARASNSTRHAAAKSASRRG
jgi:hypothetical protein